MIIFYLIEKLGIPPFLVDNTKVNQASVNSMSGSFLGSIFSKKKSRRAIQSILYGTNLIN